MCFSGDEGRNFSTETAGWRETRCLVRLRRHLTDGSVCLDRVDQGPGTPRAPGPWDQAPGPRPGRHWKPDSRLVVREQTQQNEHAVTAKTAPRRHRHFAVDVQMDMNILACPLTFARGHLVGFAGSGMYGHVYLSSTNSEPRQGFSDCGAVNGLLRES